MKTKYLIMLSEIIDKMEIKDELKNLEINTGDEEKDNEELGKELIALLITRIYKCEKEVYTFVAAFKGYLPNKRDYEYDPDEDPNYSGPKDAEQKQLEIDKKYKKDLKEALIKAEEEDVVSIFKEIGKIEGIKSFLA